MHEAYEDITSRIAEEPTWYDSNGAPRYGAFSPAGCPDIYSNTVVLLRIACQECRREFLVEMHESLWHPFHPQKLHYGDPPRHGGPDCFAGDTMNCDDLEVVECWHREHIGEWERRTEYEGPMT